MRISPVTRCTAMRKPWVLDVTLRGDPYALRASVNRIPRARAASRSSASDSRVLPQTTPSSSIEHEVTSTWACEAANSEDAVAQGGGGPLDRVARHEKPRAREGAGVEAGAVGVGLHQVDARRRGAELVAAICTWAVDVPSPNSTVPTAISYTCRRREGSPTPRRCARSEGRSRAVNTPFRLPTSQSAPSACPLSLRRRAASTRSIHCARPSSLNATSSGLVVDGQQGIARGGRCCDAEFERIHAAGLTANSWIADSTANAGCVMPYPRSAPLGTVLV